MGEIIVVYFLRLLAIMLRAMPAGWALALGCGVSRLIGWALSKRKAIAYVNLKAAYGNRFSARERRRMIQRVMDRLAQNVVEILRFPKIDQAYFKKHVVIEHVERYESAADAKKGAILITPHLGNWEFIQVVSAFLGRPLPILARRQRHSQLDDYLNELRSSHGARAIHRGGGVRDLIRVLKEGGTVGVLGDLSGGRDGEVIRFFGRKTTAPSGLFTIARRTGSTLLPCFIAREHGPYHRVYVGETFPLPQTGDEREDVRKGLEAYYRLLETWIDRFPDQWLWVYKRWKYCYTKRILVLTDDRAGHTSQSEAIRFEFERLRTALPPEYEFEFRTLQVEFRSRWHQKLFYVFAACFLPFARSRLAVLKWFFQPESAKALEDVHADIIISAGSALAPLNLLLKEENLARSIAVMKPSFPFGPHRFDLAVVPAHDILPKGLAGAVQTVISPSRIDDVLLEASRENLRRAASLSPDGANRISVFIGGRAKAFRIEPEPFRQWLSELKSYAQNSGYELLVTTSRRTDPELSELVKSELTGHPSCKLLIIANESNIEHAAYGMLALSQIAVVTGDSISMISDAVRTHKRVLVANIGNGKLSKKHKRFHDTLMSQALIQVAGVADLKQKLALVSELKSQDVDKVQSRNIQEALRKLL